MICSAVGRWAERRTVAWYFFMYTTCLFSSRLLISSIACDFTIIWVGSLQVKIHAKGTRVRFQTHSLSAPSPKMNRKRFSPFPLSLQRQSLTGADGGSQGCWATESLGVFGQTVMKFNSEYVIDFLSLMMFGTEKPAEGTSIVFHQNIKVVGEETI